MRLFSRGCESRQAAYLVGADRLGARDRIALEAHAASCADCADALRNSRPVDAALRGAFAPLRERRTIIAPGRVRLAVARRSAAAPNPRLHGPRFFGRLGLACLARSECCWGELRPVLWTALRLCATLWLG